MPDKSIKPYLLPTYILSVGFYRKYFAVFAILFYVAFGILEYKDHLMFARMIGSSEVLTAGIICLWLVYTLVTMRHVNLSLSLKENRFLLYTGQLHFFYRLMWFLLMQLAILAPVIFYSTFTLSHTGNKMIFLAQAGAVILLILLPAIIYSWRIRSYTLSSSQPRFRSLISFGRHFITWPFSYLFNERFINLLILKLLSAGILYLAGQWDSPSYDLRWWTLGVLFSTIPTILLTKDINDFLQSKKILLNQQPISLWQKISKLIGITAILCTPEVLLIITHFSYYRAVSGMFLIIAFNLTLTTASLAYFLRFNPDVEAILSRVFIFSILAFVMNLFLFPIWIFIILLVLISFFLVSDKHYFIP